MDAKLDRMLDGWAKVMAVLPRVLDVMEQMLHAMPKMLEATRPAQRQPGRKDVCRRRGAHPGALGQRLLARRPGSRNRLQPKPVLGRGQLERYKVLESGRVSIDLRTDPTHRRSRRPRREGQTSLEGV